MGEEPIGQRDQKEKYDNPHERSHGLPFLVGKILWEVHRHNPDALLYARQQTTVNISTSEAMRVFGQYQPCQEVSIKSASPYLGVRFQLSPKVRPQKTSLQRQGQLGRTGNASVTTGSDKPSTQPLTSLYAIRPTHANISPRRGQPDGRHLLHRAARSRRHVFLRP